ncbi:hypothetical protein LX32DRAFT_246526 [Colletotrichum zoysiae]|uniref:Secreted protein n=1 Tax=Colletotrichum zoysiae TaxID=1216348 RepID=A0AAD9M4R8_9PEZI|nr:hypothetical protein LX32DRAFT_246526 [Colletotrichum zoysiae]
MSMCRCQVVRLSLFFVRFCFVLAFRAVGARNARHGTLVPPTPPSGNMPKCVPQPHNQHPTQSVSHAYSVGH